jgi:TetR/AcrR family transcriptional repressor of mexJK operon
MPRAGPLVRKPRALKPRRAPHSVRDVILKAETEVFIEHGFTGSSIDQIAARAGVSKPTIYSHFDGKEKLFIAILNAVCDSFAAPIMGSGADSEDLSVMLVKIADGYTRSVLRPEIVALHRLFAAEAERFPELASRYFEAGPERVHRTLAEFLTSRMARGEIRKVDPRMLADFFAALVLTRCGLGSCSPWIRRSIGRWSIGTAARPWTCFSTAARIERPRAAASTASRAMPAFCLPAGDLRTH